MPALETLVIDSPTPQGIERLADLNRKLIKLTLREQQPDSPLTTDSGAWNTIAHMSGLKSLSIDGNLTVDAELLNRFASMIHLKELSIEHLSDHKLAEDHRRFSDKDVLAFRNMRPDLALTVNGKTYPALNDWPGKFEGSRRSRLGICQPMRHNRRSIRSHLKKHQNISKPGRSIWACQSNRKTRWT